MKKLIFLSLAIYLIGFVSCSQEQKHDHENEEHSHSTHDHQTDEHSNSTNEHEGHSHDEAEHSHSEYEVLLSEEGEKWEANPETTDGINAMKEKVQDFIDGNTESSDFESLKAELEKEYQTIFQKCTMKGEAHQQLHNYLVPMKYMLEELGSGDEELQKEKLGEIKDHLNEYSNYFK